MNLTPWKARNLTSPTRPFMGDEIANLQREMNSLEKPHTNHKKIAIKH